MRVGEDMELVPGSIRTRLRGLQSHRSKVEDIGPGNRVAANIAGVESSQIIRGLTLTTPGWLRPTIAADVHLRVVADSPLNVRHNFPITFHSLAAESTGRVRLLDSDELKPGDEGWAQVRLDTPLPLARGDFFIIRSTTGTLGGGRIVDAFAIRHRRHDPPTIERLEALGQGTPADVLLKSLEGNRPVEYEDVLRRTGLDTQIANTALEELREAESVIVLEGTGGKPSLLSRQSWKRLADQAKESLSAYHRQYPLRRGGPKEELRSRLGLSAGLFPQALKRLVADGNLIEEANLVHLPDHAVALSPAQQSQADAALALLGVNPYSPPSDLPADADVVAYLAESGQVVRAAPDVVFSTSAYNDMLAKVTGHLQEKGEISVAEVRDIFGTSRKYALALMEYLDQERVTRRVGDGRVLR